MSQTGTITQCIRVLEGGETARRDDAVRELWEYFFTDLMCYARKRLLASNASRGSADEEDAAARAFTKICRSIERGRLKLGSRVDLGKVLRSATTREVINLLHRAKRDSAGSTDEFVLGQVADPAKTPELLWLAYDASVRLLDLLENDQLRKIAIWKLSGHTNEAIRLKLACSLATLERILAHIRETWRRRWDEALPDGPAKSGRRQNSLRSRGGLVEDRSDPIDSGDYTHLLRSMAGLS